MNFCCSKSSSVTLFQISMLLICSRQHEILNFQESDFVPCISFGSLDKDRFDSQYLQAETNIFPFQIVYSHYRQQLEERTLVFNELATSN